MSYDDYKLATPETIEAFCCNCGCELGIHDGEDECIDCENEREGEE